MHNLVEKKLISLKKLIKINKEVSKDAENQDLNLMIDNLEDCYESFNSEAVIKQTLMIV